MVGSTTVSPSASRRGGSNLVPPRGSSSTTTSAAKVVIHYQVVLASSISSVSGSAALGGAATLSATLKDSDGAGIASERIQFSIGGQPVCDTVDLPSCPTTGSNGTATLGGVTLPVGYTDAGTYTGAVSAKYFGGQVYSGSEATGNLTVTATP